LADQTIPIIGISTVSSMQKDTRITLRQHFDSFTANQLQSG